MEISATTVRHTHTNFVITSHVLRRDSQSSQPIILPVMPLAVTAMLPAVLFPMTGILPPKEVSQEYLNDTNFLFLGGLIVAMAVEKCGLHERIALHVLTLIGNDPKWIMLGFMITTALLSMFISNTATAAMMLPIGLSVASILNDQNANESNSKEEGNHLLKKKNHCERQQSSINENGNCVVSGIRDENEIKKLRITKGLLISISFASNIGGVGTLTGTPPNFVLIAILSTLPPEANSIGVNYLSWIFLVFPLMFTCLLLCWFILCMFFMRKAPPLDRHVSQMMIKKKRELPPISFAEKSVAISFLLLLFLWIGRSPGFMPGIGDLFPPGFYTDSTSAMLVAILLFLLPAKNPFDIHKGKGSEITSERLMDWPTMQRNFPWNVVLLLGGGFALAAGVKESNLSNLMGEILSLLGEQPLWMLQFICILITMLVTNICSNTVTASIFIPIVASMAQKYGAHPLALMLPTTLACSFAFLLPVGSPPNAIIFSSGLFRVSDMLIPGLAVSVVSGLAMIIHLATLTQFILPANNFTSQGPINNCNGTNCDEIEIDLIRHVIP